MSVSVTLNSVSYTLPSIDETGWGANVTAWMQAVSSSTLQKSGGVFTLTADADFGATYGLKSNYFTSRTANAASAGVVRLARADAIKWRNEANGADLALGVDSSNNLEWESVDVVTATGTQTLTNKVVTNVVDNTRAYAKATRGTAQSIPNNSSTIVDFATTVLDSRTAITTGAAWKYTVPAGHGGVYLVSATVGLDGGAVWPGELRVFKNGSLDTVLDVVASAGGTQSAAMNGSTLMSLAAGDYIDIRIIQITGGSVNTIANAAYNHVEILRLVTDL